jgi:carbon-monoxide dehydrogenase medium subunit
MMAFRMAQPTHLVDINGVVGLDQVTIYPDALSIGALVRHAAFERPIIEGPLGKILSIVVRHIAHAPIRNRGTFCGSLAHADPSSEWCLVAATLGAEINAQSQRGTRHIAVTELFNGIMTTTLSADELITEVRLPNLAPGTKAGFCEFSRRTGDYAIAMALVSFRLAEGLITDVKVGLGAVEDRPRRIAQAEAELEGMLPSSATFRQAADIAAAVVDPLEDIQADADFRRDLVRAVVRRALENAQ